MSELALETTVRATMAACEAVAVWWICRALQLPATAISDELVRRAMLLIEDLRQVRLLADPCARHGLEEWASAILRRRASVCAVTMTASYAPVSSISPRCC